MMYTANHPRVKERSITIGQAFVGKGSILEFLYSGKPTKPTDAS